MSVSTPILSKNSWAASPNSGLLVIIVSSFFLSTWNLCSKSKFCSLNSELMSSLLLSRDIPEPPQSSITFTYLVNEEVKIKMMIKLVCLTYFLCCSRQVHEQSRDEVEEDSDHNDLHTDHETGQLEEEVAPSLSSSRHCHQGNLPQQRMVAGLIVSCTAGLSIPGRQPPQHLDTLVRWGRRTSKKRILLESILEKRKQWTNGKMETQRVTYSTS